MKLNRKGFTLIELLAVLVILVIIALIAIPIVLNIVEDVEKNAATTSTQNYVRALETEMSTAILEGNTIATDTYYVTDEGSLCLGTYWEKENKCYGDEFKIDVSGKIPSSGRVTIEEGKINKIKFYYDDIKVTMNSKKQYNTLRMDEEDNTSERKLIDYEIGQSVIFDPGDGINTTWYVIDEDKNNVTLISANNLGDKVSWINDADYRAANIDNTTCYGSCSDEGPITALNYLNTLTSSWNIDPISDYKYINLSEEEAYKKIEIKNGVTKITNSSGKTNTLNGVAKARLLTFEEYLDIFGSYNQDFTFQGAINWIDKNEEVIAANNNDFSMERLVGEELVQIPFDSMRTQSLMFSMRLIILYADYDVEFPSLAYPPFISKDINDGFTTDILFMSANDNSVPSSNYIRPVITISKSSLN